jgi:hypothetical protein
MRSLTDSMETNKAARAEAPVRIYRVELQFLITERKAGSIHRSSSPCDSQRFSKKGKKLAFGIKIVILFNSIPQKSTVIKILGTEFVGSRRHGRRFPPLRFSRWHEQDIPGVQSSGI